jgi:hypothetical protein
MRKVLGNRSLTFHLLASTDDLGGRQSGGNEMTVFATKTVHQPQEFDAIQATIGFYQMEIGSDVMTFATRPEPRAPMACDVYVGVPDLRLFAALPGFRIIDKAEIPDGLLSLVGRDF